jgi:hypothetical protein
MPPARGTGDAGVLFETCHDRIYRYVLGLVKNPAEAEGLTQDTFSSPIIIGTRCAFRKPFAAGAVLGIVGDHLLGGV